MTREFPTPLNREFPSDLGREFPAIGGGGGGGSGVPTDPNFSSVVLLLHLDGADQDTSTDDNSNSNHTISFSGNAELDDGITKFGDTSLILDNTDDYVSAPHSTDWDFDTGEFTIECFVNHSVTPASNNSGYISQWSASAGDEAWALFLNSGTLTFRFRNTSLTVRDTGAAWSLSTSTWYHLAVDRDSSGDVRVYIDGVVQDTQNYTDEIVNSASGIRIGSIEGFSSFQFEGNIDEVRITKGVARYGGAFTPPSNPFPDS